MSSGRSIRKGRNRFPSLMGGVKTKLCAKADRGVLASYKK